MIAGVVGRQLLRRAVVANPRRAPAHALLHTTRSLLSAAAPRVASTTDFGAWLATKSGAQLPLAAKEFLDVPSVDFNKLGKGGRNDMIQRDGFVKKIGDLIQWCFLTHAEASKEGDAAKLQAVTAVLTELSPLVNMAQGEVWQHFFARQFFLSHAPLDSFIQLYGVHSGLLKSKQMKFVPLPSALLVREYVWRGRFHAAMEAYFQLNMTDYSRRAFAALLLEYEQYAHIRELYRLQEAQDKENNRKEPVLDPLHLLQALHALGELKELRERFDALPYDQQSRTDIQKLIQDA